MNKRPILWKSSIQTPLGEVVAISDEKSLYLLEFVDRNHLQRQIRRVTQGREVLDGCSDPVNFIQEELELYFQGKLQTFQTPIVAVGSFFQKKVWEALKNISYGQTWSYGEVARAINNPNGFRAVAQAVGANPFAILIPCHRVVRHNGDLGGYAGGVERKESLLYLEKNGNI
ncbi:MAG: methylated-DNA--[protein]-cysteine S-methyltransferase [Rhabdochlamydiaceae bacterium]|nr:methylated-DNA--[protein]-cysteine S-methyltransferase [Rhabdochlamydiaceae bacterium]